MLNVKMHALIFIIFISFQVCISTVFKFQIFRVAGNPKGNSVVNANPTLVIAQETRELNVKSDFELCVF